MSVSLVRGLVVVWGVCGEEELKLRVERGCGVPYGLVACATHLSLSRDVNAVFPTQIVRDVL